ncbi:MAG: ribosome small subunit-dependent GTPase A [Gemmatimonadota bacterium]|nr:ribosome small subunit-dependent GTPase A [Gemmatimonadota bacterium]
MRIAAGTYVVETGSETVEASLRGRVKNSDERIVSVGDLVELERIDDDVRISRLLDRTSALTRHGVARRREQVIVANVDQVVVTVAATTPEPDLLMVDRLIALAELSDVRGLVVVNKIELSEEAGSPAALTAYVAIGYEVLETSAASEIGLEPLRERLEGRISVFTGQSGVGKSSLLNALMPGLDLRVGEVGARKGRGRHTTVAAALYPFPGGGYVADTPGLQYVSLWEVDPLEVDRGYVEFEPYAAGCRFSDCRHRNEPGCEVVAAVEAGEVATRRYDSYLGLLDEAEGK